MKVVIVYFSGTGNSRFIANKFAENLKGNNNNEIEVYLKEKGILR